MENNAFYNKYVFFLRQTQMDIIKYSKSKKFKKILILEDDIILANPNYIKLFCRIESSLPEWLVLNIGVNQKLPQKSKLYDIKHFDDSEMKYSLKNKLSYGTFGISFSYEIYDLLFNLV